MRSHGGVRWLSVVLLLFAITYATYLWERDSVARIVSEILVGKVYTNEILQKVVLDATKGNDSIISPIKEDIVRLQKQLEVELYSAQVVRDSLFCLLEDQDNQLAELRKDLDSVKTSRRSSVIDVDSLHHLYGKLSATVVQMKLQHTVAEEKPKTLLDSMRVLLIENKNIQKNRKIR